MWSSRFARKTKVTMPGRVGKFSPRNIRHQTLGGAFHLVTVAVLCAAGAGCNGVIHDDKGSGGTSGTGATTGTGGTGASTLPPDPHAAGLLPLRRLTAREYLNTARDLLGDTSLGIGDVPNESDDLSNNAFPFR